MPSLSITNTLHTQPPSKNNHFFTLKTTTSTQTHPITIKMTTLNASVRPWDADAANFVLLSRKVGIHAPLIWQFLHIYRYDCSLEMVEQTIKAADHFIRPWDASTANFVLISANLGMHAELIFQALQVHRSIWNMELVEETMTDAGFMAWVPTPPSR